MNNQEGLKVVFWPYPGRNQFQKCLSSVPMMMAEIGGHLLRSFSLWSQSCCFVLSWALCPHISHQLQINGHCLWTCIKPKDTGHWLPLIKRGLVYSPRHFSFTLRRQSSKQELVGRRTSAARSKGGGSHSIVTSSIFCLLMCLPLTQEHSQAPLQIGSGIVR